MKADILGSEKVYSARAKNGFGLCWTLSSLFVNQILNDNSGDIKMQFAVTPVPNQRDGEGPKLAHTAPRRQLVITLDGYLEFKSCDVDVVDEIVIRLSIKAKFFLLMTLRSSTSGDL